MSKKPGLSEWAKIAEIIGGVAIIASLIFIGVELRNTTRKIILASDVEAELTNSSLSIRIAENPELSRLVFRAEREPESLSEEELVRFTNIALPRLALWQNTYDAYRAGTMPQQSWEDCDT